MYSNTFYFNILRKVQFACLRQMRHSPIASRLSCLPPFVLWGRNCPAHTAPPLGAFGFAPPTGYPPGPGGFLKTAGWAQIPSLGDHPQSTNVLAGPVPEASPPETAGRNRRTPDAGGLKDSPTGATRGVPRSAGVAQTSSVSKRASPRPLRTSCD